MGSRMNRTRTEKLISWLTKDEIYVYMYVMCRCLVVDECVCMQQYRGLIMHENISEESVCMVHMRV